MALHDGSRIEAVAENVWTRMLARYSVIFAATIGIPVIAWSLNEGYSIVKQMNQDQGRMTRSIDALALKLDFTNESNKSAIAQTDARIEALRAELHDRTSLRYSSEDAGRDFKLRDQMIDQHDRRIMDLEHKIVGPR